MTNQYSKHLPSHCGKEAAKNSAERLKRDHGEHFLVWNMTRPEKALFNPKEFSDHVLDVGKFPLYVPTLQFTFEFCNMIRYWLISPQ